MIDVHSWDTPNGHKVHIMLEECGLREGRDWRAIGVDLGRGEQFRPEFLAISPNNKIPVLSDPSGPDGRPITLFESGAILIYLASKTGRLLPRGTRQRFEVLQWLMFQHGNLGPLLGQAHHFRLYAPEKLPYAIERYTQEARRLYAVLDERLRVSPWLGGRHYSIADVATFPWIRRWPRQGIDWAEFPVLHAWFERIGQRPAVQRALNVLVDAGAPLTDPSAREALFGRRQYARHQRD